MKNFNQLLISAVSEFKKTGTLPNGQKWQPDKKERAEQRTEKRGVVDA